MYCASAVFPAGQIDRFQENAIERIVRHNLNRQEEFDRGAKIQVDMNDFGVSIYCEMKIRFGIPIQAAIEQFRIINTIDALDEMTDTDGIEN